MLIKTGNSAFIHPVPGEITPAHVYQSRRDLIRLAVTGVAGAAMAAWAARDALARPQLRCSALESWPRYPAASRAWPVR